MPDSESCLQSITSQKIALHCVERCTVADEVSSDTLLRHRRSHRGSTTPSNVSSASDVRDNNNEAPAASAASEIRTNSRSEGYPLVTFEQSSGPRSARAGMCIGNLISNQMVNTSQTYSNAMNADESFAPVQQFTQAWMDQSPARDLHDSQQLDESSGSHQASTLPGAEDFLSSAQYASDDFDMWNVTYDPNWTAWSVGSDFDLDAMNASIADVINQDHVPIHNIDVDQMPRSETAASSVQGLSVSYRLIESVEKGWCSYTRAESHAAPGTITPVIEVESGERQVVDETYRYNLASRLQHRPCKSISISRFPALAARPSSSSTIKT